MKCKIESPMPPKTDRKRAKLRKRVFITISVLCSLLLLFLVYLIQVPIKTVWFLDFNRKTPDLKVHASISVYPVLTHSIFGPLGEWEYIYCINYRQKPYLINLWGKKGSLWNNKTLYIYSADGYECWDMPTGPKGYRIYIHTMREKDKVGMKKVFKTGETIDFTTSDTQQIPGPYAKCSEEIFNLLEEFHFEWEPRTSLIGIGIKPFTTTESSFESPFGWSAKHAVKKRVAQFDGLFERVEDALKKTEKESQTGSR